jgi:hypothetical protein
MAQHDYVIDNQTAPNFRSDLNNALLAIASNNSGSSAPSTTYANMIWYDTANNILKMRNEADDAWITVGSLDQAANTFAAAVALASQAEAEAGAENTKTMTALRTKQAIDTLRRLYEDGEDATTSGTAHNFTGIPAGMNEIDILLDSVALSGTDDFLIQIGTGGTPTTTGYQSVATNFSTNTSATNGFVMRAVSAATTFSVVMQLRRIPGTNKWLSNHNGGAEGVFTLLLGSGAITLAGALDNIRLTRTGSNTFDAGGWSIRCRT